MSRALRLTTKASRHSKLLATLTTGLYSVVFKSFICPLLLLAVYKLKFQYEHTRWNRRGIKTYLKIIFLF
uniref:Putative ovule protein n=1 Tax=Solanum chacoense TaxID=4108 RepID=A0A0V0GM29_SOLCH